MDLDEPRRETTCAFFTADSSKRDCSTPCPPDRELSIIRLQAGACSAPHLSRLHADPDRLILNRVQTMAARCSHQIQPSGFEEDFLLLSKSLLLLYKQIRLQLDRRFRRCGRARGKRLFRRLQIGKEYIHSHIDGPVSLEELSRAACLSRYHFHRAFTRVFRKTPHTYLTEIRLARAHSASHRASIGEVCLAVGFTSASFVQPAVSSAVRRVSLCRSEIWKISKIGSARFAPSHVNMQFVPSNLPSSVSMIMLGVENIARSVEFYRDTLELNLNNQSGEFAFFSGGQSHRWHWAPLGRAVQPRAGSNPEIIFPVDSVGPPHATHHRGCKFINEPREVTPGSWAATFTDPDGHRLTIFGAEIGSWSRLTEPAESRLQPGLAAYFW